jgi:hypothetical protein
MTDRCTDLSRRHYAALGAMADDKMNFLTLGEFPRGIGFGILAELMRRGLAERGISERFQGKTGWRITAWGLSCVAAENSGT